jgi:hypothetical protein
LFFKLPKEALSTLISALGLNSVEELLCHPAVETITALSNQIPAVPSLTTLVMAIINSTLKGMNVKDPRAKLMIAGTIGMAFCALVTTVADNVAAYEMLEGIYEQTLIELYGASPKDPNKSLVSEQHPWLRAWL